MKLLSKRLILLAAALTLAFVVAGGALGVSTVPLASPHVAFAAGTSYGCQTNPSSCPSVLPTTGGAPAVPSGPDLPFALLGLTLTGSGLLLARKIKG